MVKRWNYTGDVNIQYGGLYWQESGDSDYVNAVQVTPCSDAGGPDNLFWIESGTIWLGNAATVTSALESCGWNESATLQQKVIAVNGYAGIESDFFKPLLVRIGKREEPDYYSGFDNSNEPDYVLRANASLRKFVKREFLNESE